MGGLDFKIVRALYNACLFDHFYLSRCYIHILGLTMFFWMIMFADIVGCVTIVGKPLKKSTGNRTVEFNLTNDGMYIFVRMSSLLFDSIVGIC